MANQNNQQKQVVFISAEKITETPKYHANPFSLIATNADTTTNVKHKSEKISGPSIPRH